MKWRVYSGIVLSFVVTVLGQEKAPLVFQITYRDFLSGTCMFKYGFEAEYRKAFGDDDCSAGTYFTYNFDQTNCPCFNTGQCLSPLGNKDYCTFMDNWEPYFLNSTISGHPDFDFNSMHLLTGARCTDVSSQENRAKHLLFHNGICDVI